MKRAALVMSLLIVAAALAVAGGSKEKSPTGMQATSGSDSMSGNNSMSGGDSMSGSSSMSGGDSMSGANDMTASNKMAGSNDMEADPKVGHELRVAPSDARKIQFTTLAAAESLAKGGPVVIFFAADWCPYCQADLRDINSHGDMLAKDITVVVANYDTETALKTRYAVTVQDTFVQIGSDGRKLAVWNSGGVEAINKSVVRM